jgi:hypothetical protein
MILEEKVWSEQLFGRCQLDDARRTRRLVDVGARLAQQAGASVARVAEAMQRRWKGATV